MPHPDFQPTLTGETIVIRPIEPADWKELFAAAADPDIWRLHPATTRYTEPVFREFFDNAVASKMAFVFVERTGGRLIGSSRYFGYDPQKSEVEIGWTFIVRDHWGGKTNREIKRLMLDHAFTFVDNVIFWVGETNWRSQRAVEKIGGVRREGTLLREATGNAPHVVFDLSKARYLAGGALRAA
ncbi:MAG: GNAT family N-acetyltransferase [Afipia sp.]|nr:GNAT family N-acetyltransferase [Afipia sp.]